MSEDFPAQLAGLRAGSLLAGYRLEAPVGAGGMAVVFRARDERLGRLVALKILAPVLAADGAFRRRFIAESRAAAMVDDPHIIPIYEAGEADGALFIAMRFVRGGDLRRVLDREGALPPDWAAEFISPVASALDAAHRAGLVHRDVKPANILVDSRPGRPDHIYLSDFGVSKGAVGSVSLTGTGQFLGTPDYSAPEQIQGRAVDGRTDQYALACVAYQLLTGEAPFERDQGMAVLLAHLSEPPPSLRWRRPDLPAAADQALVRALEKAPEKRYGSCEDFASALRDALGLAPYSSRRHSSTPPNSQPRIVSPPPKPPGSASDAARRITETAPSPAYSAAGLTDAKPDVGLAAPPGDGEQGAAPPLRDDHPRTATGGPRPGERPPRAPRPRRAIWRHPAIIAATAVCIAVVGLVVSIITISGTPHSSSSTHASSSIGQVRWSYYTGGRVVSSPAVAGGTVYIASPKGNVYALDAATGRLRWSYTTGEGVVSSPVVAGGTIYIGSADVGGEVYALDAATGRLRWSYSTGGIVSSPAVTGGTIYVGTYVNYYGNNSSVYALDAATGHLHWFYTTGGNPELSNSPVTGGIIYLGDDDGTVYALNAATGRYRWSYNTGVVSFNGEEGVSSLAVTGGTVYLGSDDGKVHALDAATGRLRWSYTTGGFPSSPAVTGGTVYFGDHYGNVYALDAATGRLRWSYTTGGIASSPVIIGGTVYVGSDDHKVYALDAATGRLRWSYTTGDVVASSPVITGGTVYVGSYDGSVYALRTGS